MKLENVDLVEFRNSPFNISKVNDISLTKAVKWLIESTQKYSEIYDIKTGLILSLTRHENTYECGLELLKAIKNNRNSNVVGMDLSGDEDYRIDKRLSQIYKMAKFDLD